MMTGLTILIISIAFLGGTTGKKYLWYLPGTTGGTTGKKGTKP